MLKDELYKLLYAPDKGNGDGDDPPDDPVKPDPDDPVDEPKKTDKKKDKAEPPDDDISLSPEAFSKRLERAKTSGSKDALKDLGFDTVEDAEKALEEGKKAIKAQMTDDERRASETKELEDTRLSERQVVDEANERADQAEKKAAALGLMGEFANPAQAFRLLDLSSVEKKEDGSFDGLDEAIQQLAKDEPWTLASTDDKKKKKQDPKIGATDPGDDDSEASESDAAKHERYFGSGVKDSGFFEAGQGKVKVE